MLLRRSDGVNGRQAFFGEASRAFAERWSGDGLDPDVVDVDQSFVRSWAGGSFPWASTMLFQLAFAHDEAFAQGRGMKKVRTALTAAEGAWTIRHIDNNRGMTR